MLAETEELEIVNFDYIDELTWREGRHGSPFACQLNEAWVLYFPLKDKLIVLNGTAKIVWDLLSGGLEQRAIASTFSERFGISYKQAVREVEQLLADLARNGLLANRHQKNDRTVPTNPHVTDGRVVESNKLADCGVFRFGSSRIRLLSSVAGLDGSFCLRFQHRAIGDGDGADAVEISGGDSAYRLTYRGKVIAQAPTTYQVMRQLTELLVRLEHPNRRALAYCHAGAVSRGARSILMAGGSGVGKSTLTGFLAAHGFAYLGDDTVAIDYDELALIPLPTRLSIKAGSWSILEPFYPALRGRPTHSRYGRSMRYVDPQGDNGSSQTAAEPSAIIFPAYRAGEPTRLTRLRPLQALIHLLGANARLSAPATEEKLTKFVRFVEQTPAYELSYSELPEAMKAIEELLGSQP